MINFGVSCSCFCDKHIMLYSNLFLNSLLCMNKPTNVCFVVTHFILTYTFWVGELDACLQTSKQILKTCLSQDYNIIHVSNNYWEYMLVHKERHNKHLDIPNGISCSCFCDKHIMLYINLFLSCLWSLSGIDTWPSLVVPLEKQGLPHRFSSIQWILNPTTTTSLLLEALLVQTN